MFQIPNVQPGLVRRLRFETAVSVPRQCMLLAILSGTAPIFADATLWSLRPGDQFLVETTIEQKTTLQLGQSEPQTLRKNERMVFRYQVDSVRPDGTQIYAGIIDARALASETEPESARERHTRRLERIQLILTLDADGVVTNVQNKERIVDELAAGDERARSLLDRLGTPQVLTSWMAQPFWITPPAESDANWERVHDVSLGLLGSMRAILTFSRVPGDRAEGEQKPDAAEKPEEPAESDVRTQPQRITITANSRHVAPSPLNGTFPALLQFSNTKLTVTDFEGTAVIQRLSAPIVEDEEGEADKEEEAPERRPWFQNLTLHWQISGETTVKSGETTETLKFQQSHRQVSKLMPGYLMRPLPFPTLRQN